MFRGSSQHTCDPKGRLIVPSRFRDTLEAGGGEGLMITKGITKSLSAYTYNEWDVLEKKISESRSPNSSTIKRYILGNAQDCQCDKQGRILIPKELRVYAQIEKDIMLIGMLDRFEIWSFDEWENENQKTIDVLNSGECKSELADLGL